MNTTSEKPAVLGGTPTFSPGLAFTRPAVPPWDELSPQFQAICESGNLTKGPNLAKLEAALKEYIGCKHVICVHSCTSGLLLGIQSLKLTGEVLVPSFSFPATFHALKWNNLQPIFVDCEPDTLTVDPAALERAITPRTSAVMSAYLFGNPPDMAAIDEICQRRGLKHFCDSAHGMGTKIDGVAAGNHADFEVFSASPTKLLTAAEGGVVTTPHAEIADWIRIGRDYANPGDYDCRFPGLNARMSEFHAVLMLTGLKNLESSVQAREAHVNLYETELGKLPGVTFQKIREGCRSSRKDFAILIDEKQFGLSRDGLKTALESEGIPTRAYFDPPGHKQTPYRVDVDLPVTEKICACILCLPMSVVMTHEETQKVIAAIRRIHEHAAEVGRKLT